MGSEATFRVYEVLLRGSTAWSHPPNSTIYNWSLWFGNEHHRSSCWVIGSFLSVALVSLIYISVCTYEEKRWTKIDPVVDKTHREKKKNHPETNISQCFFPSSTPRFSVWHQNMLHSLQPVILRLLAQMGMTLHFLSFLTSDCRQLCLSLSLSPWKWWERETHNRKTKSD